MNDKWRDFLIEENLTTNNFAIDKRLQLQEADVRCKCTDEGITTEGHICYGRTPKYHFIAPQKCPTGSKSAEPAPTAAPVATTPTAAPAAATATAAQQQGQAKKKAATKKKAPSPRKPRPGPILQFQKLYNKWVKGATEAGALTAKHGGLPKSSIHPQGEDGYWGSATGDAMKDVRGHTNDKVAQRLLKKRGFAGWPKGKPTKGQIPQYLKGLRALLGGAPEAVKKKPETTKKKSEAPKKKRSPDLVKDVDKVIRYMDGWVDDDDMEYIYGFLKKHEKNLEDFFEVYKEKEDEDLAADVEDITAMRPKIKKFKKKAVDIIKKYMAKRMGKSAEDYSKADDALDANSVRDILKRPGGVRRVKGKRVAVPRYYGLSARQVVKEIFKTLKNSRKVDEDDLMDNPVTRAYFFMLKKAGYKGVKDNAAKTAALKLAAKIDDLIYGSDSKKGTSEQRKYYLVNNVLDPLDISPEDADDAGFWDIF
tara:strand:+ start:2269 stop:3705 length:1437 start_codon:yes stop_codon:yes gene_type:complete